MVTNLGRDLLLVGGLIVTASALALFGIFVVFVFALAGSVAVGSRVARRELRPDILEA
jgi:hypothetical protein